MRRLRRLVPAVPQRGALPAPVRFTRSRASNVGLTYSRHSVHGHCIDASPQSQMGCICHCAAACIWWHAKLSMCRLACPLPRKTRKKQNHPARAAAVPASPRFASVCGMHMSHSYTFARSCEPQSSCQPSAMPHLSVLLVAQVKCGYPCFACSALCASAVRMSTTPPCQPALQQVLLLRLIPFALPLLARKPEPAAS